MSGYGASPARGALKPHPTVRPPRLRARVAGHTNVEVTE